MKKSYTQFGLRSVLLVVPVIAGLCYTWLWHASHAPYHDAQEEYKKACVQYATGTATAHAVCVASTKLCKAEEKVLFADKERARALHLARLVKIERQVRARLVLTLYEDVDAAKHELEDIDHFESGVLEQLDAAEKK